MIDKDLLQEAREAKDNAYCKYSNFRVGAAVLTTNGTVFRGCNVENASYGLTVCAERTAIFAAVTSGERRIRKIAISAGDELNSETNSLMPCGACRQVISEFSDDETVVIIDGVGTLKMCELLPNPFALN